MRVVVVSHNDLGRACLEELLAAGADVQGVFTLPDRPDVADQTEFAPVTESASVPLHHVESINDKPVRGAIDDCDPDLLFVVGWSELVDRAVLDLPRAAALGMHPSPLPRGRGRAPIAWSLIKGLDETALSLFHLVEAADAGDVVGQQPIPIDRDDDAASLYEKVVDAGRDLIATYYPQLEDGTAPQIAQDDDAATWWPKREPRHGLVDWNESPEDVYDWIRGQTRPYPGAYSFLEGKRVTIWGAAPPPGDRTTAPPGTVLECRGERLRVAAWEGVLDLTECQLEGESFPAGDLLERMDLETGTTGEPRRTIQFANARDRLAENGGGRSP